MFQFGFAGLAQHCLSATLGRAWLLGGLMLMLMLSACSSTTPLALYSVSQAELNQMAQQQISRLQQQVALKGLPLQFAVRQLDLQIAPAQQPVVLLSLQVQGSVDASLVQLPVGWQLELAAQPYFDRVKQGIYLRQFQLKHSEIHAGQWQGRLKPLTAPLQAELERLLADYPVYQLDKTKWQHRLLLDMPLQLQLLPGEIILTPAA
jgi:hypothetical protein